MQIEFIKGGSLTTIQDLGRHGYQQFGVIVSGAMDPVSLKIGNMLVQNDLNEGCLEMTLSGALLKVPAGLVFALTGADMDARLNGTSVPCYKPIYVMEDAMLSFGFAKKGARAYMAVAGGFNVPLVMNSKSTYLRAKLGGYQGRALKSGDILGLGPLSPSQKALSARLSKRTQKGNPFGTSPWAVDCDYIFEDTPVHVTEGLQYNWFSEKGITTFFSSDYTITANADRMGYRMDGPQLEFKEKKDLISEPINLGAIQVPPDGKPIILMADRQTTGGYPKIGQIVMSDIPHLAQLLPGRSIRFKSVTMADAESSFMREEQYLGMLAKHIPQMEQSL
jgi:antagonist of KipI